MNYQLLLENLTNPALLFFVLGIIAVRLKSDLAIPSNSAKFISLYLLFSIGFKGGQELAHSPMSMEIVWSAVFGLLAASLIPLYTFFILKRKLSIVDAGAVAATYGSVSAVTFVTAITFLESHDLKAGGHMVAVMALMEVPAIVIGVMLIRLYSKSAGNGTSFGKILHHSLTNGSVLLIIGSLIIGFLASDEQAMGIKPFTTDLFKGFMAIFLLDMGIESGRKLSAFIKTGWFTLIFAIVIPLVNGCLVAWLSHSLIIEPGDRFLLAVLASSASYIAVPAAMRIAAPEANSGIFVPMALAVTFPMNITLGLPIYYAIAF
jgi:uncharacterized protein